MDPETPFITDRRFFLWGSLAALTVPALAVPTALPMPAAGRAASAKVPLEELTLADIATAFADERLTSQRLTKLYVDRIEAMNHAGPALAAVIEMNPKALTIAADLDRERIAKGSRSPLHGVPVLIKDNIETADHMMTTAGSLALEGWYAPQDAPLVARLRAAGAVILGKSNLSEWANFRSTHAVSGWSARGGQARNPYALNRSPSGSSSGSAIAVSANLCALAVGSETDGSIVSPASVNGIVGLKPTVGLVSRGGIVPLSHTQDTAGPLTRTVRDAAVLLGIMAGFDASDAASAAVGDKFQQDYVRYLDPQGLKGARLGIARKFFADNAPLNAFLDDCIDKLKAAGAIIVDPADLPLHGTFSAAEKEVLLYEFKSGINMYLARLPSSMPAHSLADLIRYNETRAARELPYFDQELFRKAETKGSLNDAAYTGARTACLAATRDGGIDAVLAEHHLDAMVALTNGPASFIDLVNGDAGTGGCSSPAAVAGYPHITVPAGLYRGLPVGLSFFGAAFSEPTLIRLASGFEHAANARARPQFLPGI